MKTRQKKLFTTAQNFEKIKEILGEEKSLPTKKQMREFLNFWQDVYDVWKRENSPNDLSGLDEKIRVRKELVEKFGIRN